MKIYRVIVRGQFDGLDDEQRAELLGDLEDHHFLRSAFTKDGTLTYDEKLIAFNFRYEVRESSEDVTADEVGEESIERTAQWLDERCLGHRHLRCTVTDMSTMWD